MDERLMQFRVGVMVLSVALLAGFLILLFGRFPASLGRKTYTVYILFGEAPNVERDTPIQKSGVLVGRVTGVDLQDEPRGVRVTAEINQGVKIWHNETVIVSSGLLGDSALRIVPNPDKSLAAEPPVAPGETIAGLNMNNPMQTFSNLEGELTGAARSLTSASNQVMKLAKDVDQLVGTNDDQFRRLLGKTERSLDTLEKTMQNANEFVGDPAIRDNLRKSVAALPKALEQTEESLALLQKMSVRAEKNLQNLEGFTGPLGERGPSLINHADQSVRRLDEILGQLQTFTTQMNNREGSLGQLMNNPQLYNQVNEAAININDVSKQLKPILADARVLSDKLARHPELLGVRGALEKSPGIK